MKIINLTPHDVVWVQPSGTCITFEKTSQAPLRVEQKEVEVDHPTGLPMVKKTVVGVVGLPKQQDDTFYIVSSMVLASSNRTDLIAPDTGPNSCVRNDKGHITGVRRFTCN